MTTICTERFAYDAVVYCYHLFFLPPLLVITFVANFNNFIQITVALTCCDVMSLILCKFIYLFIYLAIQFMHLTLCFIYL